MSDLNSIKANNLYNKIYSRQSAYSENQKTQKSSQDPQQLSQEEEQKVKNDEFLSNSEINTLHMFFGSDKPEEMQFYGNNKVKSIHKGQFLDLKG